MNEKLKVAIYCRLSEEDRNKENEEDDSTSIKNQKLMLAEYAIKQGWDIEGIYSDDDYRYNKAESENSLKNMLFTYFESYKANTINLLIKSGYSQNMLDDIEEDILEYVTSKATDILTEKLSQDRIKNYFSLNKELNDLSVNIINEAEARFKCDLNGTPFDELKEKRDSIRQKAQKLEDIRMQIASLDIKTNEINGMVQKLNNERILL